MAQRRMFSLDIVDSDAFLDMPASTQAYYFHLAMRADDDGFVDNPKKILKIVSASEDDLKILIAKRFVLTFDNGIIVIKHWRINNYIQNDRYKETKYTEEKKLLEVKDNQSYTERIQNGYKVDTQVSLGKVRLGKSSLGKTNNGADKPHKDEFETEKYPKENYKKILDQYQTIKDVKLQGDEFLPIMREIKIMFKSQRTPDQIIEAIETCNDLYDDWSMNTVRMKIADVVAGKIKPKNYKGSSIVPLGVKQL